MVRLSATIAASLVLVLGVADLAIAAPQKRIPTGFNNGSVTEKQIPARRSARILDRVGAKIDRVGASWAHIEPRPGKYDFAVYDEIYAADLARGIKPLFIFAYAPRWASGLVCAGSQWGCYAPPTPDHYDDAARVAAALAARYPKAAGIEIWNEPNAPYFWRSGPDPAAYTRLLAASYRAIKAVNPSMKVVGPATSPGVGSWPGGKIGSGDFLAAVLRAGGGEYLDAVSIHAYPSTTVKSVAAAVDAALKHEVNKIRAVRNSHGYGSTPLWITETGASTTGPNAVSEAKQARIVKKLDRRLRAPGIKMLLFHTLIEPNGPRESAEPGYGILTHRLRPKLAFCKLAAAWGHRQAC